MTVAGEPVADLIARLRASARSIDNFLGPPEMCPSPDTEDMRDAANLLDALASMREERDAWAEIAERYRSAMLAAEQTINSTPMPVGAVSQVWKRVSDASTALWQARQDMIAKHGTRFLNSGPLGDKST